MIINKSLKVLCFQPDWGNIIWRGQIKINNPGGWEPGRTGGRRGTKDGKREGGKWDLYNGGKRERNSKRQASVICNCQEPITLLLLLLIIQPKKRTQQNSLTSI